MQVGSHTLEVRADATGRIRELNEADNVFTRTVEVMPESTLVK
jgi:subtilase family serine protease